MSWCLLFVSPSSFKWHTVRPPDRQKENLWPASNTSLHSKFGRLKVHSDHLLVLCQVDRTGCSAMLKRIANRTERIVFDSKGTVQGTTWTAHHFSDSWQTRLPIKHSSSVLTSGITVGMMIWVVKLFENSTAHIISTIYTNYYFFTFILIFLLFHRKQATVDICTIFSSFTWEMEGWQIWPQGEWVLAFISCTIHDYQRCYDVIIC